MTGAAALLDGVLALPATALEGRVVADPDEDAITLAATAALPLLDRASERPRALILATVSPTYDEGGNVQVLAELLGLAGELVTLELTSTLRDGLTAIRVGSALAATGVGPILVAAAHRARGEQDAGDGAVAVLLGTKGGVGTVRPLHARAEELRDRWRLAGRPTIIEGDPSFVWDYGAPRVASELATAPCAVVGPVRRSAERAERAAGGPGDPLAATTGVLGAAHPLARVLFALEHGGLVLASAGGLTEVIEVSPGADAAVVLEAVHAVLAAPRRHEAPELVDWGAFAPYQSGPRAWRERGQELRLEGVRCTSCERLTYPQRPTCPACGCRDLRPAPLPRTGTVVTETRDHAYPAGKTTGMAVVDLDGGGRFYGQVVPSAHVSSGDRVRLVPRRLHDGGGFAQYHWKVAP